MNFYEQNYFHIIENYNFEIFLSRLGFVWTHVRRRWNECCGKWPVRHSAVFVPSELIIKKVVKIVLENQGLYY